MSAKDKFNKVIDELPDTDNINVLDLAVFFFPTFESNEQLEQQIQELKQREKKLRECVEFYADKNNWWCPVKDNAFQIRITDRDYEYTHYHNVGGKRARQCLKELGD